MQESYEEIPLTPIQTGELCDTIYYQGNSSSQTQALKYLATQPITASTNETMWCTGRNNLQPLNAIYKLYIGPEIADVNLNPFSNWSSYFNPLNWIGSAITYTCNQRNGFHFSGQKHAEFGSVRFHAPILAEISIGQESDLLSHKRKYDEWLKQEGRSENAILWGVSRGTAATFVAFAKEKYPNVRLVVLEGAIDTVPEVINARVDSVCPNATVANPIKNGIHASLSFFNRHKIIKYSPNGPSPMQCVDEFPEGVPVVFITSKRDTIVPCRNTERIANALAERKKNDVFLLKLERSSHPNYMFDDADDRNKYETFLHAIYQRYGLKHDPELAERGQAFLEESLLYETKVERNEIMLKC